MCEFTQGEWENDRAAKGVNIISSDGEYIASVRKEEDARLIVAAPRLYELLREELIPTSDYGGIVSFSREAKIRDVIESVNGGREDKEEISESVRPNEYKSLADQLEPCKFCGKKPLLFTCEDKGKTLYFIHCPNPYCWVSFGMYEDFEEARDFWNNGLRN